MKIIGIIPARYASSRFPGKMLADIGGKSMVQRVYEQCKLSTTLSDVIIATDDDRIQTACQRFGAKTIFTRPEHPSGTDRCFEAYQSYGLPADFVINIQGDEPFIKPEQIDTLANCLTATTELATLIKKIETNAILENTGNVKVVFNKQMEALYFSRHAIPFVRGKASSDWISQHTYFEHVGLYAYRVDILEKICQLPLSDLEAAESLEQLRWLENGYKIQLQLTEWDSYCIETPEDLEGVRNLHF